MAAKKLAGMRVAVLAADGFEQVELTMPKRALEKHGARAEVISLRPGHIRGMNLLVLGKKVKVDRTVFRADPNDYDALLLPGGFINPDFLRQSPKALDFVRAFDLADKPIAVICHGPWLLASAGLLKGRRLTSWPGIKHDVLTSGGDWIDAPIVRDRNWVSSRGPHDMVRFIEGMLRLFEASAPRRVGSEVHWVRWLAGSLALAGVGLLVRQRRLVAPPAQRLLSAFGRNAQVASLH